MPFNYTNEALIDSIKTRAMIPTSQATFTDDDLLSLADEEMQTVIFPMMMAVKGDYFVAIDDTTMTSALSYPIPSDVVGLKIKDCYWRDPSWPDTQPDVQIPQVNLNDVAGTLGGAWVVGYYIQENSIILVPQSIEDMTLRIRYYKRASKLVPTDEAGQITAINTGTRVVTLDNVPAAWVVGNDLSAIDGDPGFLTLASDLDIQSISSPNVTLSSVDDFAVGDWLCLEGDSPIPQITPEAHAILAQAVAVKCLEALGDPGLTVAQAKFEQIKNNFIQTMTPRADGQAKKIIGRNSPLAWRKVSRWGWGGYG